MISGFFGEYRWLSNFWIAPFTYDNVTYQSVEHFYQASKALIQEERLAIINAATPGEAKRLGRAVTKLDTHLFPRLRRMVMKIGVDEKFGQNKELGDKLLATDNMQLQETNTWGDTYWGVCNGVGSNHLGFILMQTRSDLRYERIWDEIKA